MKKLIIAVLLAGASFGAAAEQASCAGYAAWMVNDKNLPVEATHHIEHACKVGAAFRKDGMSKEEMNLVFIRVMNGDKQYQQTGKLSQGAESVIVAGMVGYGGKVE